MKNMEYIMDGHEGVKPQGGPGFQPMTGEHGETIYLRKMPHYPDIVGKLDVKEHQLVMEYAGCRVTYDHRKIREEKEETRG